MRIVSVDSERQERTVLRFVNDPGHGWLEVPVGDVRASGAEITPFSMEHRGRVYLEEDCDFPSFVEALGGIEAFRAKYEVIEVYTEDAPCRNYPRWRG